jgi:acyl-CoA thioester hydrolase
MEKTKAFLSQFPITLEVDVQWGDMDAALHVNNTVYLRWVENSRVEYFRRLGYGVSSENGKTGFILGWQDCKYIFPVTYPDTVIVGAKVTEIGKDRFTLQSHIFSKKHQRLAAISNQTVVSYDYSTLQKVDVPEGLKNQILSMGD